MSVLLQGERAADLSSPSPYTGRPMKTMMMHKLTSHHDLTWTELDDPEPGPRQVAIDVGAIGCNFADTLICKGAYQLKPGLPFAPGSEVAGVVRKVGSEVRSVHLGQRVFATMPFGGYATVAMADEREIYPLVEGMPFADAAGFGVAYLTSYLALTERARLRAGEHLLIHAAAGGVGLAALQIGVALGARVIASAGDDEKRALCRAHGAQDTIDYRVDDWPDQVKAMTGGRGADVIYDPVGGDTFDRSTKCIAFDGRILIIGFASGRIPEIRLNRVMLKNIGLLGLHINAYREHAPERLQAAMAELLALYGAGKVRPLISAQYALADAAQALNALSERRTTGKVVLVP